MMKIILSCLCILASFFSPALFAQENKAQAPLSSPFSQVTFIPDISLILDVSGVYRSIDDHAFGSLEIPGYIHGGGHEGDAHGHDHASLNENIGFNLNYAELALSGIVDPYFELFAVCHMSVESFELEEAYFNTTAIPYGFGVRIGKFFSRFGRINEQHAHSWDFSDQPLVYYSLFGSHGINEIGGRLSWVAPMDTYFLIGAEVFRGSNENSFGTEGFEDLNNQYDIEDSEGPNLYIGFMRTSFDIADVSILLGASGGYGKTRINHGIDEVGGHALSGRTWFMGGDLTIKYYFDSYRYISLQTEYIYRDLAGSHYHVEAQAAGGTEKKKLTKKQSGMYGQLVLRPHSLTKIGLRFDLLNLNEIKIGGEREAVPENTYRLSAMVAVTPSEFSLFRLQYNFDRSRYREGGGKATNHEVIMQANLSIGAHGAHSF